MKESGYRSIFHIYLIFIFHFVELSLPYAVFLQYLLPCQLQMVKIYAVIGL